MSVGREGLVDRVRAVGASLRSEIGGAPGRRADGIETTADHVGTTEGPMLRRRALRLALLLTVLLAVLGVAATASAAGVTGTIALDPATTQVDNGATFSLKVTSNTSVPISGLSASIKYDKSLLQIKSIARAAQWASAPLFLAADDKAIALANSKGYLQAVAADFFPPGSVPAGSQDFVTVTFQAVGCGTANLTVPYSKAHGDSDMLDGRDTTYGNSIPITTTGATVTVCQGGASGSQAASASGAPGSSGSPGPSDSVQPGASDSTQPGAGAGPAGGAPSAAPSAPAMSNAAAAGLTSTQSDWLTFALAALGVAAVGLAVLILILVVVAIVASVVGGTILIRVWRTGRLPWRSGPVAVAAPDGAVTPGAAASESARPTAEDLPTDATTVTPTPIPGFQPELG